MFSFVYAFCYSYHHLLYIVSTATLKHINDAEKISNHYPSEYVSYVLCSPRPMLILGQQNKEAH